MIKKISIISFLTVSILFSSFYVKQKRAEAIFPFVAYVAISAVVSLSVGAYLYMQNSSSSTLYEKAEITAIDATAGAVSFEFMDHDGDGSEDYVVYASNLPFYPTEDISDLSNFTFNNIVGGWNGSGLSLSERLAYVDNYAQQFGYYSQIDYYIYSIVDGTTSVRYIDFDGIDGNGGSSVEADGGMMIYDLPINNLGYEYTGDIGGSNVTIYEYSEDVPVVETCFDGIINQDETGVDCGGVCTPCPIPETCVDNIMNQDETGIDYGGVCGTDDPVAAPAENFTDTNQDGVDDLSGLDATGSITVASPGDADGSTYDTSLPGDISEVGETDWTGLITGYLATNPLVLLATGSSINLSGEECTLTANVFNSDIVLDFCSVEGLIDLIGTFVLGLMAIRSVFIAMGI
jgi:hypothetical protein